MLAFELLDCADLELTDKEWVLTAVDYNDLKGYLKMINDLKKFIGSAGVQMPTNVHNNISSSSAIASKSEPVYVAEEANVVRQ